MNITPEQFEMSLDYRFKSTTIELPKKEGKYYCIIPGKIPLYICTYKDGFFQQTQDFEYHSIITRYRVSFWIEEELYDEYKLDVKHKN
jgi:hypothetical protein